jgi:hypothetical protein
MAGGVLKTYRLSRSTMRRHLWGRMQGMPVAAPPDHPLIDRRTQHKLFHASTVPEQTVPNGVQ